MPVGHRVEQQLADRPRPALVAQPQRRHRGQVAAGAVAADDHPRRIGAERGGMLRAPAGGGQAVLRRRRERVFRRQAVVDRGDDAARPGAEVAADAVMRVEAAEHEAAAMVEDQQREGPRALGGV